MAGKAPREVAGLGRPETPREKSERVATARAERKARQNTRNLVWSLLASLGVVALLVILVVRPDTNLVDEVDWVDIAAEAKDQLPGEPIVPMLSDLWSSNRAEITSEAGSTATWSIGLLGPERSYVFVDQGFDADVLWLAERTVRSESTGSVTFGYGPPNELVWKEYDRREQDPTGNNAYVVVLESETFTLVVGGTDERGVREVANDITYQLTQGRTP
jgi:hypothetical protein